MEALHEALFPLLVAWGIVTAILIFVLIYRSMLENREEDQIFLDAAAQSMANEQRALVARIEGLSKPITALIVLSSVLLVTVAGLWLWQGFQNF
jgi:H+/Cl- antiporter ClcA